MVRYELDLVASNGCGEKKFDEMCMGCLLEFVLLVQSYIISILGIIGNLVIDSRLTDFLRMGVDKSISIECGLVVV